VTQFPKEPMMEQKYMQRCLELAQQGVSYVAPNPMVGAVLVCDDEIIGEGYHRRYGEAHAEPNAFNSVKDKAKLQRSTLYVSLEPCSHFGKTPPCANLVVQNQIPRVVIGTLDPNPKVAGRGVAILREAGIDVVVGVLEAECRELNKRFFIIQEQKRPYVLLKWAQTSDGFIDITRTNHSEQPLLISNEITKQLTHKMRAENQAILVGANTVLLDNPSLTVRNWSGRSPIRVAIDRQGRIPENFHLMDGSLPTLVFTEKTRQSQHNLEFIRIEFDANNLSAVLRHLYERNIHSVMVEGGATILNSFIDAGLWDEANVEISTASVHEGVPAPKLTKIPVSGKVFNNHQWLSFRK
jgi:diaminohydroxyphosphoribosylaminopyrimidine deaminase / 5-amino-6-(5-phosphoribosylamino)uracil reductase